MFDYETLRIIWWLLLGVVIAGFAMTDGYDLGALIFLRILPRDDNERIALIETFEPMWEGHQVWFVLGGGATFAAWPLLYAASFSGFYFAMLLVLLALIVRPVGLSVRAKMPGERWRATWDGLLTFSGVVPSLLFGVALGNLFLGVPLRFDSMLRMTYEGGLIGLLRPFALLCGLVSLSMLAMHGLAWLVAKAHDELAARAARWLTVVAVAYAALYVLAGLWLANIAGFRLDSVPATNLPSHPLGKTVSIGGSWFANGPLGKWAIAMGIVAIVAALACAFFARRRSAWLAFAASSAAVGLTVLSVGFAMFPFLMPSTLDPKSSLTVWDASSSRHTLGLMLFATAVLLPIVLAYTAWVFSVMRGRVSIEHIKQSHGIH
jgi:cytochrome d ubiquinol oxidase subunit II